MSATPTGVRPWSAGGRHSGPVGCRPERDVDPGGRTLIGEDGPRPGAPRQQQRRRAQIVSVARPRAYDGSCSQARGRRPSATTPSQREAAGRDRRRPQQPRPWTTAARSPRCEACQHGDSKPAGGHAPAPARAARRLPLPRCRRTTPARWTAAEVTQARARSSPAATPAASSGSSSRASAHSSPSATAHLQRLAELGNPPADPRLAVPSGMPSRSAVSLAVRP